MASTSVGPGTGPILPQPGALDRRPAVGLDGGVSHPQVFGDDDPVLARLREVCLALPGSGEKVSHGRPVFHTTKVFAIYGATVKGDHDPEPHARSVLVQPDPEDAEALRQDERTFVPAYWGPYGWVGLDLHDDTDWAEVAELVEGSYRLTAPRRLVAQLDERGGGAADVGGSNMDRLERVVGQLPEAERVDVAEWGDHPTFRVREKAFVFSDQTATQLSLKLTKEEAAAVVATDPQVEPAGYGLGRHGWVAVTLPEGVGRQRWAEVEEWVRTSYALVAPKRLARQVLPDA